MIARGRLSSYALVPSRSLRSRSRKGVPRRATLFLCLIGIILLYSVKKTRKLFMDVLTGVRYRLDSSLNGRTEPGPRCSFDKGGQAVGKNVLLSYIRTDDYLPLVEQLRCSLRKSNPQLEMALMVVDTLSPKTISALEDLGIRLIFVDDLQFPNRYEPRFRYNWLKIRAFELEEYDGIVLVDSDTVVLRDISEMFRIPARFAAVCDQGNMVQQEKYVSQEFQGGVFFVRPCSAVAHHMQEILRTRPKMQFSMGNAEQEFFTWYFRYEAWTLPLAYNTMVEPSLVGGKALGGDEVKILHFTRYKPFQGKQQGVPGHEFLCTASEIRDMYGFASDSRLTM